MKTYITAICGLLLMAVPALAQDGIIDRVARLENKIAALEVKIDKLISLATTPVAAAPTASK